MNNFQNDKDKNQGHCKSYESPGVDRSQDVQMKSKTPYGDSYDNGYSDEEAIEEMENI